MPVKRFYKSVTVGENAAQHTVLLDGKQALTPGRNKLAFRSRGLAQRIAAEWAEQGETIAPQAMPLTRLAYAALDSVEQTQDAVRADLVKYAGSDLVCYRAEEPEGLVQKQAEAWDPIVFWAREKLTAPFVTVQGIQFTAQPPQALENVRQRVHQYTTLSLAALHSMTTLMGSSLLALAVADKVLLPLDAWSAAHVDEEWTDSFWGKDAEAEARKQARWVEMNAAADFLFFTLEET